MEDKELVWAKTLEKIKNETSGPNFKTWFGQTTLGDLTPKKIIIKVPSAFIKGELARRYERLLKDTLAEVTNEVLDIEYQIDPSLIRKKSTVETDAPFEFGTSVQAPTTRPGINPKYTMENFVVGLTNNLAYAASQAVVQSPGVSYNPLFIYGQSGVGKTHLMQAIGNALLKKNPYFKVVFVSSEKFMNDHVESIQNKKTGEFRARYRMADVLLVDDIQFIAGKDSTQEEFFHTFNELHSKNSQIVLTSDRPPQEMKKLESRLMTRFQGGLMVDIQIPDFDTRVAILKTKLKERGETLPQECLNLIAESVESNARELEGKLIQILQTLRLRNLPANEETVRSVIGNKPTTVNKKPDQKKVLESINRYFNLKMSDLLGPRRQKGLVLPRQLAMFILYTDCGIPMEKVGQILGGRDHTTILHGVDKIRQAINRDREIQRLLIELKQQIAS